MMTARSRPRINHTRSDLRVVLSVRLTEQVCTNKYTSTIPAIVSTSDQCLLCGSFRFITAVGSHMMGWSTTGNLGAVPGDTIACLSSSSLKFFIAYCRTSIQNKRQIYMYINRRLFFFSFQDEGKAKKMIKEERFQGAIPIFTREKKWGGGGILIYVL